MQVPLLLLSRAEQQGCNMAQSTITVRNVPGKLSNYILYFHFINYVIIFKNRVHYHYITASSLPHLLNFLFSSVFVSVNCLFKAILVLNSYFVWYLATRHADLQPKVIIN